MSHIPASAMHHAKTHENTAPPEPDAAGPAAIELPKVPEAVTAKVESLPWAAIAIGGALAAGVAITAAIVTRKPAKPKRAATGKPAAKRTTPAKPRRKKTESAA